MARIAAGISLTPEEEGMLRRMARSGSPRRLAERAQMILLAAQGLETQQIARTLHIQPARVSKWRTRFAKYGPAGLSDTFRGGKPRSYGETAERMVLDKLAQPPPRGQAGWSAQLLAQELEGVSKDQVWRILRRHGVVLRRRRQWGVSTDPEFVPRTADVAGLYLSGNENALVLAVDRLAAAALPVGLLRLPGRAAANRFRRALRSGASLRLATALTLATESAVAGQYRGHARRHLADFVRDIAHDLPRHELHLFFEGRPGVSGVPGSRSPEVHWHVAASHAVWLSHIESWFTVLGRKLQPGAPRALRESVERFLAATRANGSAPFEWRKLAAPGMGAVTVLAGEGEA